MPLLPLIYKLSCLAQADAPWDSSDPKTPAPAPSRGMSFSDLQRGLREQHHGDASDAHYRHLLFIVIGVIILLAILLNLRQRRKTNEPPEKPSALFREISKTIRFPFATRTLLRVVAKSANLPAATLLISRDLFESALQTWMQRPTFTPFRTWAAGRLNRLRPILFQSETRP